MISLLERFYDVTGGTISVDGKDIRTLDPSVMRLNFGLVAQEPVLFGTSIMDNICYGTRAAGGSEGGAASSKERVVEVAKMANAHEFISQFPEGYETMVGERGIKLSGGQKQVRGRGGGRERGERKWGGRGGGRFSFDFRLEIKKRVAEMLTARSASSSSFYASSSFSSSVSSPPPNLLYTRSVRARGRLESARISDRPSQQGSVRVVYPGPSPNPLPSPSLFLFDCIDKPFFSRSSGSRSRERSS